MDQLRIGFSKSSLSLVLSNDNYFLLLLKVHEDLNLVYLFFLPISEFSKQILFEKIIYYCFTQFSFCLLSEVIFTVVEFIQLTAISEGQFILQLILENSSPIETQIFDKLKFFFEFIFKAFYKLRIIQNRRQLFYKITNYIIIQLQYKLQKIKSLKMDFLREIVGGPKNRYKQNGFNLDLTYITNRIIAMAFPASGFEKLYRNSIDSVCQFLTKNHNDKYITINLSGREIDEKKLKNVKSYFWEDHRTPTFDLLFNICNQVCQFLKEDPQRVSVFHCNHGKGRTGTIICCFFLYIQAFKTPTQALYYYAQKRFQCAQGYGVTQPAQVKYIEYFFQTLNKIRYPKVLAIKSVIIKGQELIDEPYFKVRYVFDKSSIVSTKNKELNVLEIKKDHEIIIRINQSVYFAGDVVLDLKKLNTIGSSLLGSYMFNTAFIESNKVQFVNIKNITPLSAQKAGNLPQDFSMEIQFKSICQCEAQTPLESRCNKCKPKLLNQRQRWKVIQKALKNREEILEHGIQIGFGKNFNNKSA